MNPGTTSQTVHIHRPSSPQARQAGPWSVEAIQQLLDKPLLELVFEAQTVHRQHWPAGDIELATLLSVKTGGCPENCGYCPQAAEFDTGVKAEKPHGSGGGSARQAAWTQAPPAFAWAPPGGAKTATLKKSAP